MATAYSDATAYGAFIAAALSAPPGSAFASGGSVDGNASGDIAPVSLIAPSGSAFSSSAFITGSVYSPIPKQWAREEDDALLLCEAI